MMIASVEFTEVLSGLDELPSAFIVRYFLLSFLGGLLSSFFSCLLFGSLLCREFGSFFLGLNPGSFGFKTLPFLFFKALALLILETLTFLGFGFLLDSPFLSHLSLPFFLFSL